MLFLLCSFITVPSNVKAIQCDYTQNTISDSTINFQSINKSQEKGFLNKKKKGENRRKWLNVLITFICSLGSSGLAYLSYILSQDLWNNSSVDTLGQLILLFIAVGFFLILSIVFAILSVTLFFATIVKMDKLLINRPTSSS